MRDKVDRAIEGLFERLCVYVGVSKDEDYAALHAFLLSWIRGREGAVSLTAQYPSGFDSFDAYAAAFPEAETYRSWLTLDGTRSVVIVPGMPNHGCLLPGGFLWAFVNKSLISGWQAYVGDADDGDARRVFPSEQLANEAIAELRTGPVSFQDLQKLRWSL
jgi:hypothetical protein